MSPFLFLEKIFLLYSLYFYLEKEWSKKHFNAPYPN